MDVQLTPREEQQTSASILERTCAWIIRYFEPRYLVRLGDDQEDVFWILHREFEKVVNFLGGITLFEALIVAGLYVQLRRKLWEARKMPLYCLPFSGDPLCAVHPIFYVASSFVRDIVLIKSAWIVRTGTSFKEFIGGVFYFLEFLSYDLGWVLMEQSRTETLISIIADDQYNIRESINLSVKRIREEKRRGRGDYQEEALPIVKRNRTESTTAVVV